MTHIPTRHFHTSFLPPAGDSPRNVAAAVNSALKGKLNCIAGPLTLMTNTAATVFQDPRLTVDSWLGFDPLTANGRDELYGGTMLVPIANRASGQFTVEHANNAQNDREFLVLIIG